MGKKCCFFDVDNTLAPYGQKMSASVVNTLHQLKKNGIVIFVNSGRAQAQMPSYILSFDFDGFIFGCGTRIVYQDKIIYEKTIDESLQEEIYKDTLKYHLDTAFEGEMGACFIHNNNPQINEIIETYHEVGLPIATFDEHYRYVKCCLFLNKQSDIRSFMDKYKNVFDFFERKDSIELFYEAVPKGISKAHSIYQVCELLNISIDDCYAFGDSGNDLSMLRAVKHSIAMGNGAEDVKAECEFVTHDCKEDGIEFAAKHYGLI